MPQGFGWVRDLPDARDYTCRSDAVSSLMRRLPSHASQTLPDAIDLRRDDDGAYFGEVDDQGSLHASSAFAVLSMAEYFQRRIRGEIFEGSTLFLHAVSRQVHSLAESDSANGVSLRATLKAFASVGVPDERHWPYDAGKANELPSSLAFGFASQPAGLRYFRLDCPDTDPLILWDHVCDFLAAGFPIAFGFSVPQSISRAASIPYRPQHDSIRGGQSVVAVGYELNHFLPGQHGLLIRNSWGSEWGDNGYGWLPSSYVTSGLSADFWVMVHEDWLDPREVAQPIIFRMTS